MISLGSYIPKKKAENISTQFAIYLSLNTIQKKTMVRKDEGWRHHGK